MAHLDALSAVVKSRFKGADRGLRVVARIKLPPVAILSTCRSSRMHAIIVDPVKTVSKSWEASSEVPC
jgi:hypothetical protein